MYDLLVQVLIARRLSIYYRESFRFIARTYLFKLSMIELAGFCGIDLFCCNSIFEFTMRKMIC